jgi:hypothetical protein
MNNNIYIPVERESRSSYNHVTKTTESSIACLESLRLLDVEVVIRLFGDSLLASGSRFLSGSLLARGLALANRGARCAFLSDHRVITALGLLLLGGLLLRGEISALDAIDHEVTLLLEHLQLSVVPLDISLMELIEGLLLLLGGGLPQLAGLSEGLLV